MTSQSLALLVPEDSIGYALSCHISRSLESAFVAVLSQPNSSRALRSQRHNLIKFLKISKTLGFIGSHHTVKDALAKLLKYDKEVNMIITYFLNLN